MRHFYTKRFKTKQWDMTPRNKERRTSNIKCQREVNAKSIRQKKESYVEKDAIHDEQIMNCDMSNNIKIVKTEK